jgi:hypothetical protein
MKMLKKWRVTLLLCLAALLVHFCSYFPHFIENQYTAKLYPKISQLQRWLLGRLPFSVGDILYGLLLLWLLIWLLQGIKWLKKIKQTNWRTTLPVIVNRLLLVYLLFNILWGLNYSRLGIAPQMQMLLQPYSTADLYLADSLLIQKTNYYKQLALQSEAAQSDSFAQQTATAYQQISTTYPFLRYPKSSIKPSLWGWLGNYLGFMGYYNPFTGEAQVNTTIPAFLQPFVFCHETAHQLGYAKEDEANFVGFLTASQSGQPHFQYSAYLDMWLYSQRNLFMADSMAAKRLSKQLLPEVKQDLKIWQAFTDRHQNPAEPIVKWIYAFYLKRNNQPAGMMSYDAVVAYLIAYYKKYGQL